jgi:murein tripeptide amidase MpaA
VLDPRAAAVERGRPVLLKAQRPDGAPDPGGPMRSVPPGGTPPFIPLLVAALVAGGCGIARTERPVRSELVAPDGSIDWNRYYTSAETNEILRVWADRHPQLTRLFSIGRSYLGADLLVMEVTNRATGPASEKPALYLDGGIHAGELTGSAVAFYVLGTLLAGYGTDPRITALLDRNAFYVRPKFNPDGSDLVLATDQPLRSTVRPFDDDEDGLFDEDPPDDLDGDGRITQMRVVDPDGRWVISPDDPRIMLPRRPEHTGPFYTLMTEGIDNDGDGRYNEDGIGGLDMNRNYPRNWELEHIQPGSGAYPLSEPEVHATVRFISDHPNIVGIVHGHTSGGFVYRLPSAMDPATMNTDDLALVLDLGAHYTETTGRPVIPSATHPTERRYGTLIAWGYLDRGIVGWVPEYVPRNAWVTDYDGDGEISEAEQHRFNDEMLGGKYFTPWTPYDHPQLGPVEIGGWWNRFWVQNTPPEFLEEECALQVEWILRLLERAPRLAIDGPRITPLDGDRFRVDVTVANEGWLPTNLTERGHEGRVLEDGSIRAQIVAPPHATLEVRGGAVVDGPARIRVGHLAGASPHGRAATERRRTVSWTVQRTAPDATVRVTAGSPAAGTVRGDAVPIPQ